MKSFYKILVAGILIGAIILFGIWLSWQQNQVKKIDFYSCAQDSNCIKTKGDCCGCSSGGTATAINKNFEKDWQDKLMKECYEIDCLAVISNHPSCFQEPKCINNKCVLEEVDDSISIIADKTEYKEGETVNIEIKNNLSSEIWIYPFAGYTIDGLQNEDWVEIKRVDCPCGAMCELPEPYRILEPYEAIKVQWSQKEEYCEGAELISSQVPAGRYIAKSQFSVPNSEDKKTIYKEFIIKGDGFPADKESCEALGGKWGRIGAYPEEECNLPTSDAGKECSGYDECEGSCLADLSEDEQSKVAQGIVVYTKGKCSAWKITVGCLTLVEEGKVSGIICID